MSVWLDVLWFKWLLLTDAALELWERFQVLDQALKPVVIVALLFCLAVLKLVAVAWAVDVASVVGDETDGSAPTGYRPPPSLFSPPKRWLEHYVSYLYVQRCRKNRIGWFSPWLITWLSSLGVAGCAVLSVLEVLGIDLVSKQGFLIAFTILLMGGVAIAYAHNAGRLYGRGKTPVRFLTFVGVFAAPVVLTVSLVGFTLFRPGVMSVVRIARAAGIVG